MNQQLKDARELLSKPGDTISETLEHLKMSQSELAERMGKTPSKISDIISGKEPITIATSIQLEKVLGINADFWIKRETQYREKLARLEQKETLEMYLDWVHILPLKELKKYGYITSDKASASLAEECLKFYGIATPKIWESTYASQPAIMDYRKSSAFESSVGSMTTWLRIGELEMRKLDLPIFSKEIFREALTEIRSLVTHHTEDFAQSLKECAAKAGVAIIYTPSITKAPISGVARWIGGNPLIQLTDRYKTNDQFWFTVFHEAGHILLHGKKDVFIDELDSSQTSSIKEDEANAFANKMLTPDEMLTDFEGVEITEKLIKQVARRYKTHAAIVLARLQHLEKVPYSFGSSLKLRISLEDDIVHNN